MSHNRRISSWIIFLSLVANNWGCGSDSKSDKNLEITAPTIENSNYRGLIFAALSADQSVGGSSIYRYDFKAGKIFKLLQGESSDPILFQGHDSSVILFNRHSGLKNYKVFDPFAEEISPKPENHNLTTGDPRDALLIDKSTLLLAMPLGQKLQTLNTNSGAFQDAGSPKGFSSKSLRPTILANNGDQFYIVHSGLQIKSDGVGESDGTQQVYQASLTGNSLTFNDLDTSTNPIDGSPLTATFPTYLAKLSNQEYRILGLCTKQVQNCVSGVDSVKSGKASKIAQFSGSAAGYVDQIEPSETEGLPWALVSQAQDKYVIAQLELTSGLIKKEVHVFAQKRLYGLKFDPGSQTLFVGDTDGDRGELLLFKDGKKTASVEIDGVFYRGLFVK